MTVPNEQSDTSALTDEETKIADEAIAWFSRLRMKGITPEDHQAFQRWYQQSPTHRQIFQRVSAMWEQPVLKAAAVRAAHTASSSPFSIKRYVRWSSYTAVTAAVAVLLILATLQWDLVTRVQADYFTAVGEQRSIQLPDQSMVTMNTQTAIAVVYEESARKVQLLKGEAFFKVQADRQRPFIVEHQGIATRAVGTEFVVQAKPNGVQVTVLEGLIQVSESNNSWPEIGLGAGSQVRVEHGKPGEPRTVDPMMGTAWLRGRLVVTSVRLGDVIEEVRRYYPGTIIIWNPEVKRIQVTGTYDLHDPAKLLTTLSKTLPFRMVTLADRVVVLF